MMTTSCRQFDKFELIFETCVITYTYLIVELYKHLYSSYNFKNL